MNTFDFFFGITPGELLFKHSDNFSKMLQACTDVCCRGTNCGSNDSENPGSLSELKRISPSFGK